MIRIAALTDTKQKRIQVILGLYRAVMVHHDINIMYMYLYRNTFQCLHWQMSLYIVYLNFMLLCDSQDRFILAHLCDLSERSRPEVSRLMRVAVHSSHEDLAVFVKIII